MNIRTSLRGFLAALAAFTVFHTAGAQQVFINEVMASNSSAVTDPDYQDYADWIELYNPGPASVNLNGYSITDLLSQPKKFVFSSDLIVPSGGYVLVWADDKGTGAHANFKLSASGEGVGLFDPAGRIVDSVTFGQQDNDISYGRFPDGTSAWSKLYPSSPASPNRATQVFGRMAAPVLSANSGFFGAAVTVTMLHPAADAVLRYTLDGHTPGPNSPVYNGPIRIASTSVLRARAFQTGFVPSPAVTATYFIGETTQLPVFSLVTDPENFFSDTSGIYVEGTNGIVGNCATAKRNWNQDWERPVDLELFEKDRQTAFKVSAGVKIYGGCSRLYAEKSLAFYFRPEYGYATLPYQLFPDMAIKEFNNFTLRSSGQDWWRTMFRDGMAQTLVEQGMKVDDQNYRPSVLFINGQYWGIHNIGERLNEHYLFSHHGVDPANVDIVEVSKAVLADCGDLVAYNALITYITNNSPALSDAYAYVSSVIDIDEYIDYTLAQIYAANGDWPGSNMKLWRERTPNSKWRWMMYDLDFTFGGNTAGQYYTNTLEQATATNGPSWPNPPWSTLMLRRLLENIGFRNEFIQRYAVHLNTTFEKTHVVAVIDSLARTITAEIPRHKARWSQSISMGSVWSENVQVMRDFALMRPDTSRKHFMKKFSIAGTNTLVIARNDPAYGKIYTHGVEIRSDNFAHVFFRNIPLKVKAVAAPGCRFVRWQGAIASTAAETTFVVNSNSTLTAVFESGGVAGISPASDAVPGGFALIGNYPNPFNPSTTIRFAIPRTDHVTVSVYDMLGREIETLADGRLAAGEYNVTWHTQGLPSGVYLCRLRSSQGVETRKMTLAK